MVKAKNCLVIVESPAKCKKIEGFLGPGYRCIASFGHITTLQSLKDIDVQNHFKPTFKMIESKSSHIQKLRAMITKSDEVILATDDDREGEAIAWHICQLFKLPVATTKRIIFHEITKTAIQRAVLAPTTINMDTVHAQQARQIIDIIVGFKLSPLLWSLISRNSKNGLSAGRCQTPALRIIYENQKEIDKSPGKMVYNTTGYFTQHNLAFSLNHNFIGTDDMEQFLEDSVEHQHVYTCGKVRSTTKNPPKPFTTSRIQQTANTELRCSPKETMALCQKLYENGFITYMRTDSETYSKEFLGLAKNYVGKKWGEDYVRPDLDKMGEKPKKKKKEEKDNNAQEAHEAIRPTDINRTELISDFSAKERKMYALIWRNTVESCMAAAKYNAITAIISAPQKKEYKYSTEQAVFPGWKVVAGYEKENAIYAYLKSLKSVDTYKKIVAKVTVKELKTHYTEAKLVQILEEKGIGRPSTFASLVEKIQERGYVKRDNVEGKKLKCIDYELEGEEMSEIENTREFGNEKNKLVIQSVGIMVIEFLLSNFEQFFDYDYTKTMENNLDKIAKNELIWHHLCRECLDDIDKTPCIQEKKQYRIDDNHVYMVGKYGPVIKYTSDDGETTKFKNVKKDLDVTKIEKGEYSLEELLEEQHSKSLGKYKGDDVFVKKGKYGYYAQSGKKTQSLARYDKDILEITLEDVVGLFGETPKDVVRPINNDVSIRKSKYGLYIYYKTPSHKKPEFISLKKFTEKVEDCDSSVILEYVGQHKKK
jgi:DNA topoisomerase-1